MLGSALIQATIGSFHILYNSVSTNHIIRRCIIKTIQQGNVLVGTQAANSTCHIQLQPLATELEGSTLHKKEAATRTDSKPPQSNYITCLKPFRNWLQHSRSYKSTPHKTFPFPRNSYIPAHGESLQLTDYTHLDDVISSFVYYPTPANTFSWKFVLRYVFVLPTQ
jgi:hypothetical protein